MENAFQTPADYFNVRVPKRRDVTSRIWSGDFMDSVSLNLVSRVCMSLLSILKEQEAAKKERRPSNAYLLLAALPLDQMTLLERLWDPLYIQRVIVTQILDIRGEALIQTTYNELSKWYLDKKGPPPLSEMVRPPTRAKIVNGLRQIHMDTSTPEVLESIHESLVSIVGNTRDICMADLAQMIREYLFFFDLIWGTDFVWELQYQQTPLRLVQRQALIVTAGEIRNHLQVIRAKGPINDEVKRIRIQIWVDQRILSRVSKEFKRMAFKVGESLDQPISYNNPVTWRDRLDSLLQRPSIHEVAAYVKQLKDSDVTLANRFRKKSYESSITWTHIFRQLIRHEFGDIERAFYSHDIQWRVLAEEFEHLVQWPADRPVGNQSVTLMNILGVSPTHYVKPNERHVLERAERYCRRRYTFNQQSHPSFTREQRAQLNQLNAMRSLMGARVSDMLDLVYDFQGYLMAKNGSQDVSRIMQRAERDIVRVIEKTGTLFEQAAQRIIQCHIGAIPAVLNPNHPLNPQNQQPPFQCKRRATGHCRHCNIPMCGSRDCTKHHLCAYCIPHGKGHKSKDKHTKKSK